MKKLFEGLSLYDFQKRFPDDKSCIDALCQIKWPSGFSCRYCNYTNYCGTRRYGERRCCSCKKPESPTAHTLFHKIKFPLHKAFMMIYLIGTTKKGISALELHRKLGVHKRTALLFKRKVMTSMVSDSTYKMSGLIEVDEIYIKDNHKHQPSHSPAPKKLVIVGIERCGKGISRAYVRHIKNGAVNQLKPFFEDHFDQNACIKTDGWRSYRILKDSYPGILQPSKKNRKRFSVLHRFVRCLQAWIKGIFGRVRDLQAYLDEYVFKFNRHKMKGEIIGIVLKRMVAHPPKTYRDIFSVN